MNFTKEVNEIIHLEYDPDDIATDKVAKAITYIYNKQIQDLKMENANHRGLLRTYATENADLKSQLASVKYLNADEVKALIRGLVIEIKYYNGLFNDPNCPNTNHKEIEEKLISLFIRDICNLAIKVDREKIIEVLDDWQVKPKMPTKELSNHNWVCALTNHIIKALEGK